MIHYRIVQPEEIVAFRAVRLDALRDDPHPLVDLYRVEQRKSLLHHLSMLTNNVVMGAYFDDALSGMTCATILPQERIRHKAIVWGTYVAPTLRGQSVGTAMQRAALDHLITKGVRTCLASVAADNLQAITMFKRVGFFETHHEKNGMRNVDDGFCDLIHLMWHLDATADPQ
jgi:RimJ/RimL family protein N-acetyltransferase